VWINKAVVLLAFFGNNHTLNAIFARMYVVNVKGLFQTIFFAAVTLTVSCTLPQSRISPPSSSTTPATKGNHRQSKVKAPGSSSTPTKKTNKPKSKSRASTSTTKRKPRYRVLEHYGKKAFEDTVTGKIWTMQPVVHNASLSLAKLACRHSRLGGHHWGLPLAGDFIKLTDSEEKLTISEYAPFRRNYDKYGPFWTRTKVANTTRYYVVGFDKAKRYEGVDANIGKYTAVCIQK
jgi:hypothetical protein